ncbi:MULTISPECIES: nicotinate-nucleotide--dimethylbenzimidazole phosphoribosyltransferase [unclassified Lentimonas]|uniref:nicotinate-nucleotide--dimethylbenzimidazole phosphoribosyltransferase n=1 Tax=unclassified Lentimonas TaxID=2630993 RepID=UPI001324BBBA|nr:MULTISPECIES: nicotinate-nucleotide--dimethylbenzimidazole phosphoribosyltransferase [unclassified Lentimonas]CAA6691592.1 Nicotinate-nucleotide--dimethylbenzimidazole phosphoribosyltransferase (EC [Lentimonas sp. CC10]CAA6696265.1 Nicotinate-nucleotide--dimethylbenzimidazole phosphoribosyltransferase (EC [Lentimonas sp. CC19]CAA7070857.1 Nicotinate-nucleotide--dimethylbenzimidazole phosphoribosyltransferase (EC [Lentimonas sp. CC11]
MITQTLEKIQSIDRSQIGAIQHHLDDLLKPQGSLGRLEDIAMRYVLASGRHSPKVGKKRVCVFAADHGVVEEGHTFSGKEVTAQVLQGMLRGGAGINVLSRHVDAESEFIDVGVWTDLSAEPDLLHRKIAQGTRNMTQGAAMSAAECEQALCVGIERANQAADDGVVLLAAGEMGIGNTTPSSALLAALLPCPVQDVTGPGAGLKSDAALKSKIDIIERSLAANQAALQDPFSALCAVGGLEIAAMCGLYLGAAARRVPVVVDGFIASAAALVAVRMCPAAADYMFFSHRSAEPGHDRFMQELNTTPLLDLQMRLGEGTGAVLAMTIIDAAIKLYGEMATFSALNINHSSEDNRCFPL